MAKHLNSKLHSQAKKLITDFNKHPEKCMTLDLSSLLDNADECLLNFIQELIRPIREGRRKLFTGHSSPVTQEHKMRHLYILLSSIQTHHVTCPCTLYLQKPFCAMGGQWN